MSAGLYDIAIEQGADWDFMAEWKTEAGTREDLTGCTARMQVRENYQSSRTVFSLTSEEGGGITLGGDMGTITIHIPAETTAAVVIPANKCTWVDGKLAMKLVYDLEIVRNGAVIRLLQGACLLVPEVTK